MVIDTSAVVAAIAGEPDRDAFGEAIVASPARLMFAVTFLETKLVLLRRLGPEAVRRFEKFVGEAAIEIVALVGRRGRLWSRTSRAYNACLSSEPGDLP